MTGCSIWPACRQHPALDPSRYVAALSLNDRFHLHPQRAYYLLVSVIAWYSLRFYGAFIVQCPRPHLRQQRQQKMKKPDLITKCGKQKKWGIHHAPLDASSEINAMAQNYISIWPACRQHPALDPSRYVAALSLNDRFHLHPQRAYYLLVGIPYVQFFVKARHIHYSHENNRSPYYRMLQTEEICNWGIWFNIFRLMRTEDIMRLAYASREINAMAQSYFKFQPKIKPERQ
ncbi:hypothetical protein T07_15147 [Trichinella nelsoni]|uniref:Uncharacterized protein n=1 Tax=Trichinella nelsoni TaxID=6336 RepID=A0A0V0S4B5_9BILA|nr:hypothetical protein T07_15147 [Trichinella nelsoni]